MSSEIIQVPTEDFVLNFSHSSLASWLHGLPRYGLAGERVTNVFTYDDIQYYKGVGMMLIPFAVLALVTVLFFLIRCIIVCVKCCMKKNSKNQAKPKRLMIAFFISFFIVIGGLIYGFIANQKVSSGIGEVRRGVLGMKEFGDATVESVAFIGDRVDDVINEVNDLEQEFINFGITPPPEVAQVKDLLATGTDIIDSVVSTYSDIPLDDVVNYIRKYDRYRWGAQIGLLLLLSVPYWMVAFGILCKCKCLVWNVTWVAVICAFFAWILSGIESFATVVFGDVCVDAVAYALDKARDVSDQVFDFANFYLICAGLANPVQSDIDSVTDALSQAQAPLAAIQNILDDALTNNVINQLQFDGTVSVLNRAISTTALVLDQIVEITTTVFRCEVPHNNVVRAVNGICDTTLGGLFGLIVVQVLLALCMWLAIVCGLYVTAYLKSRAQGNTSNGEDFGIMAFAYGKEQQDPKVQEMAPLAKDV